jgi:hypothetical protein
VNSALANSHHPTLRGFQKPGATLLVRYAVSGFGASRLMGSTSFKSKRTAS